MVDLEDAAIIRRDQKGKLHVTTPAHHAVAWGTLSGLFWGMVIGLLLLPLIPVAPLIGVAGGLAGAGIDVAADLTIEEDFKRRVQDMLQPGTSALLVIIRKVTMDRFLEALASYGGTVLKTSLPQGAEEQLMKVLHGAERSAATWSSRTTPRRGCPPRTRSALITGLLIGRAAGPELCALAQQGAGGQPPGPDAVTRRPQRATGLQLAAEPVDVADQLAAQRPADRAVRGIGGQRQAEQVLLLPRRLLG